MTKLASALVLAATLVVPVAAYADSLPKDKTSDVDHKMQTKDGKASPGTTGAMNNGVEGGSFTASKADQSNALMKKSK